MKVLDIVKKILTVILTVFVFLLVLAVAAGVIILALGVNLFRFIKESADKNAEQEPPINGPAPDTSQIPQSTEEKNAEQEQRALAEATGIPFIPPPQKTQPALLPPPQEVQPAFIPPQEEQTTFIPPQEEQQILEPPQELQPTFTNIISNVFKGEQDSLVEQEQEDQRLLAEQQRIEQELLIQASREAEEKQRREQELLIQASLDAEERQRREQELLRQASLEAEAIKRQEQELLAQQENARQELLAQQEQTRLKLLADQQKLEQELLAEQRRKEAEIIAEQERILAEQIQQEKELLESIKTEAKRIASSQLSDINADNVLVLMIDDINQKTADSSAGMNMIDRQKVLVENTESSISKLDELISEAKIKLTELVASVANQEDLLIVADVRRNVLELLLAKPVLVSNLNNAETLLAELVANAKTISDKIISLEGQVARLDDEIAVLIQKRDYYTRLINEPGSLKNALKIPGYRNIRDGIRDSISRLQSARTKLLGLISQLQSRLN